MFILTLERELTDCGVNFSFFRQSHVGLYLKSDSDDEAVEESDTEKIGTHSCVTLFVKKLLLLVRNKMAFVVSIFLNNFKPLSHDRTKI